MIELLVVIGVITLLASISFPIMGAIRERSDRQATAVLVRGLSVSAATYRLDVVPVDSGTGQRRPWDVDQDGILDGDRTKGWEPAGVTVPGWYRGLLVMAGIEAPGWAISDKGIPLDRWGNGVRVRWGKPQAGTNGLAIYSIGPDGLDATHPALDEAADDIRAWDEQ